MIPSPQTIQVARDGVASDATVSWRYERGLWVVEIIAAGFGTAQAEADDAFEALCLIREQLEPLGWRIGVAGAQAGVWPSGMARDQGGGLSAYRLGAREGETAVVDTFAPVDPSAVTTVVEQRAEADRLMG